jgi:hypothetical protein
VLTEAEVVSWLKRALRAEGLQGRQVREILVDADSSYRQSRFRRQLEPMGTVRIDGWRPDLVCVVDGPGVERLAGFEVKARPDQPKGVIQASHYRAGVHEAYLCIPENGATPSWLRRSATRNGIGLVRAGPHRLELEVEPNGPVPDPRTYLTTRRYLLGETTLRTFALNKPLHYAAALTAHTDLRAQRLLRRRDERPQPPRRVIGNPIGALEMLLCCANLMFPKFAEMVPIDHSIHRVIT